MIAVFCHGDAAACAVGPSQVAVGLDVERLGRAPRGGRLMALARRRLAAEECAALEGGWEGGPGRRVCHTGGWAWQKGVPHWRVRLAAAAPSVQAGALALAC